MPVDPMIARGGVPLDVTDTLARARMLQQRDRMIAQDETKNALWERQQQAALDRQNALAADEDEQDRAFEAARAAGDWDAMAAIDPVAAKTLWDFQQARKPKPPVPQYGSERVGGFEVLTENGQRVGYRSVPEPKVGRVAAAGAAAPEGAPAAPPRDPIPTSALRIVDEAQQAIAASSDSQALVDSAIGKLERGEVKLGAIQNMVSRGRNFAGASDENSRAYTDIRQTLEKLRNNYLLLAKGVQTEGDAQRAWNSEIGENVQNDNALALQQLKKARGMVERAVAAQNRRIENVYSNFGQQPPAAKGAASGGNASGGFPEPPQAAIDALRANPELAPQFVAKYGRLPQGFSTRP